MRILLVIGLLVCGALSGHTQDPYFIQNLYHTLYLNPAYAGYGSKLKTTLSYRNQWRRNDAPAYRTIYASADAKAFCFSNDSYVAFGGYVLRDEEFSGMISHTRANLSIASSLLLSRSRSFESRLLLGFSGGLINRSFDFSDELLFESVVTAGDNFDPVFLNGTAANALAEDVGVGMGIQLLIRESMGILIGASGVHLTSPKLGNEDRLARKFGGNILLSYATKKRMEVKVYSDFARQGKSTRSQTGVLFGLAQNISNNSNGDDFGLQGGLTVSLAGDENRSMVLESVSPVLAVNYLFFDFIVTKDFNVSTSGVANQRGGTEFIFRFRINDHKIKSKERLPKLCSEACPLP